MMDDTTRAAIESIRHSARKLGEELDALAKDLSVILDQDDVPFPTPEPVPTPPPAPPSPPPAPKGPEPGTVLLEARKGVTAARGVNDDRAKLLALFNFQGTGWWADPSQSLEVRPDGSFVVVLDKARRTDSPNSGGSSWVNACLPLPTPVDAAEISYVLEFGPAGYPEWGPGAWGESMKFPGLQCWTEGKTPGGGEVTPANFSVRPCSADWLKDGKSVRWGPYVYGQHRGPVPDQYHREDYPTAGHPDSRGTLVWSAPVRDQLNALPPRGGRVSVTTMVERVAGGPTSAGRVSTIVERLDASRGRSMAADVFELVGPGRSWKVTHVPFVFMYGGDSFKYGPVQDVTAIRVTDFRVVAR